MSGWISAEDRMPLKQDYKSTFKTLVVLVTDGETVCEGTYCIGGNHVDLPWESFSMCMIDAEKITHWMPLPEPPNV